VAVLSDLRSQSWTQPTFLYVTYTLDWTKDRASSMGQIPEAEGLALN
jgi:hypothetical protein